MTIRKKLKWRIFGLLGWFKYFGIKVYFPPDSGAFRAACAEGIYEQSNARLLNTLVQPGTTCFDVGANIGLMAVPIVAGRVNSRVVSFEPSPTVVRFLERTIAESNLGDRWQLVNKAVGASNGVTEFFVGAEAGALYDGLKNTNRAGAASSQRVEITTLDEEWKRLGRPQVSAIKIDVEGNEIDVLDGAVECIQAEQPTILMEWNSINLRPLSS